MNDMETTVEEQKEPQVPAIPWLERIKEPSDTPPDTDYLAMLEELEYK